MCLNHPFSFGAMFSRKNEVDHVFKPGLVLEGMSVLGTVLTNKPGWPESNVNLKGKGS